MKIRQKKLREEENGESARTAAVPFPVKQYSYFNTVIYCKVSSKKRRRIKPNRWQFHTQSIEKHSIGHSIGQEKRETSVEDQKESKEGTTKNLMLNDRKTSW